MDHGLGQPLGLSFVVGDLAAQFGVKPFKGVERGSVFHARKICVAGLDQSGMFRRLRHNTGLTPISASSDIKGVSGEVSNPETSES